MNLHYLVFNYDRLVDLESKAWAFMISGRTAAIRESATRVYNELKSERARRELIDPQYIDFDQL